MKKYVAVMAFVAVMVVSSVASAATFKPDDEGFIRNWLLLEPITLDEKAGSHDEDRKSSSRRNSTRV